MKSTLSAAAPLAAAVLAAAFSAGPAMAAEASGMVIAIDAETGLMRAPTADEMKALQAAGKTTSRTGAAPVQVTHANGAVELALGEETMMYSVARLNAQGKLERACVQGLEGSQKAMKAPVSFATRPQASRVAHAPAAGKLAKEPLDVK